MFFDITQAPSMYAQLQQSLVPQLTALTPSDAQASVAACPGWSVKDVMAHVSGLVAETLANVPLPRGSDEATARQVADRSELSLTEVCDEWVSNAEAFADFGAQDPGYVAALTSDLVVHAIDIDEAIEGAIEVDPEAIRLVAGRYGQALEQRAAEAGCPLSLVLDGVEVNATESGSAGLILRTSPFDFLRAVTARCTGTQVRAMDWTGDPEALLANAWSQYGPLVG